MEYLKEKDKIIIKNCDEFSPCHILECGQVFRYKKTNENYTVYSQNKKAEIVKNSDFYEVISTEIDYFENYFDLKTSYSEIQKEIVKLYKNHTKKDAEFLNKAIEFGKGIRILNQDKIEAIIGFVISQNNNIKRIQLIIERLCEKYGTNMGDYYAFPNLKQLENVSEDDYKNLGLGYRASYMVEVVKALQNFDFKNFSKLTTENQLKEILKIKGIGPKVADCLLLFGFHKMDCFPVDVWIIKVYNTFFDANESDKKVMHKNLLDIFKNYAGYAQQYLFYYLRSIS